MIIGLRAALDHAEQHNTALAAVNTPFFEALLATIEVGERLGQPIVLQFAQAHEAICSITDMGPAMVELARRSPAPFVLHVDHGETLDYIRTGLDIGFNSAMIDGSRLPYTDNVRLTSDVVALASDRGVAVEGEIGVMTGNENGNPDQGLADEELYTDPDIAAQFVRETGLTALAASFGTVHGIYARRPNLNYALIAALRERTGVPIVMHGGSGLSPAEYRACIRNGVRKINYYTYAAKAAYDAVVPLVADPDVILFANLAVAARAAVAENVAGFVRVLSTSGQTRP